MTEPVSFPGSTGARLAGVLHIPDGRVQGSVLLAHCFTCSKDLHTMTRLADGLSEAGYAVMRFDFTGLGDSGGDFTDKTVSRNVVDLVQAATELVQRGYGPCALVGHSLGGAATLLAAHRLKTVRSVVVIGAPSSPRHVRRLFNDQGERIRSEGVANVTIAGRPFPITRAFLDDLDQHDQLGRIAEVGRPLLVLHAIDDEVVDVGEGERIFAAARQPKAFIPSWTATICCPIVQPPNGHSSPCCPGCAGRCDASPFEIPRKFGQLGNGLPQIARGVGRGRSSGARASDAPELAPASWTTPAALLPLRQT